MFELIQFLGLVAISTFTVFSLCNALHKAAQPLPKKASPGEKVLARLISK